MEHLQSLSLVRDCSSPPPITGQAMDEKVERGIVEHLQNDDMVVRVIDPKSEEMGDGVYRWAAPLDRSTMGIVFVSAVLCHQRSQAGTACTGGRRLLFVCHARGRESRCVVCGAVLCDQRAVSGVGGAPSIAGERGGSCALHSGAKARCQIQLQASTSSLSLFVLHHRSSAGSRLRFSGAGSTWCRSTCQGWAVPRSTSSCRRRHAGGHGQGAGCGCWGVAGWGCQGPPAAAGTLSLLATAFEPALQPLPRSVCHT